MLNRNTPGGIPGWDRSVSSATGAAITPARQPSPHLIVLDLRLPDVPPRS
jgi:hypothetical protein